VQPIDLHIKNSLNEQVGVIEGQLDADVMTIISPIVSGLDVLVKAAVEAFKVKRPRIAIILDTLGGIAEVVERMVSTIRHHYGEVYFIVPDRAMSAGTIFAMSGDRIFMNYFSVLGPIDPQIEKDGSLVPAQSYLSQYERLSAKATAGTLNTAEYALLTKLDLGELHRFEQAKQLSIDLLELWLSQYKFKDWATHASTGQPVTDAEKRQRAKEVGHELCNNERWHSHGRGISRDTLEGSIRLRIDRMEGSPVLLAAVDGYYALLRDYMTRSKHASFVHTREFF
jgi:hypothetical protein